MNETMHRARPSHGAGIAQKYALIFGTTYLAVALLEVLIGREGLSAGDTVILQYAPVQNIIHWLVGAAVLGSYFAGEAAARLVARIVGLTFVAVTLWGFIDRDSIGSFFGFDGSLPWIYNIVHLLTAAAALFAGFAASRVYAERPAGSMAA